MRVLILGGTRFTGPFVVDSLRELGHQVTVFHRGQGCNEPVTPEHLHGDIASLMEHRDKFRALEPDVVVHMCCLSEPQAATFVEVFQGWAPKAVVISSADVYRSFGGLHRTEPAEPSLVPHDEYSPLREELSVGGEGYNKTAVERIVMNRAALPCTVLRYPAVYGPNDPQHRFHHFLKRMDDGRPAIPLPVPVAEWRFTHGYSENVAYATVLAVVMEEAVGKVYNVGDEHPPRLSEWVELIGKEAGWTGKVVVLPVERFPKGLLPDLDFRHDLVPSTQRIRRELGYEELVSRDEAMRRTIAWERANPPASMDLKDFDYESEDIALAE